METPLSPEYVLYSYMDPSGHMCPAEEAFQKSRPKAHDSRLRAAGRCSGCLKGSGRGLHKEFSQGKGPKFITIVYSPRP